MTGIAVPAGQAQLMQSAVQALDAEAAMITELCRAMEQQRTGVATDDAAAVETATLAMARAVLALDEARRIRVELLAALPAGETVSPDALANPAGPDTAAIEAARRRLRLAAEAAAREAALTRAVLRRALDAGDALLQRLFDLRVPLGAAAAAGGAVLVDRMA